MRRPIRNFLLLSAALLVAAAAVLWARLPDPCYTVAERLSFGRYHQFDAAIDEAARRHGLDPLLVRAVVWRESQFDPSKVGASGERGLMQVGAGAASDWVRLHKASPLNEGDLFTPQTNLEIGVWYLARAVQHWSGKDDPVPFALAEYNAGKKRVDRWIGLTPQGASATADELRASIDFPRTRAYVTSILRRRDFYRRESGAPESVGGAGK